MCHIIGFPPISIIGFGFRSDSSEILVPKPPAKITAFNIFTIKKILLLIRICIYSNSSIKSTKEFTALSLFKFSKAYFRPLSAIFFHFGLFGFLINSLNLSS